MISLSLQVLGMKVDVIGGESADKKVSVQPEYHDDLAQYPCQHPGFRKYVTYE